MGLLSFLRRPPIEHVSVDDEEVVRELTDGRVERIRWRDLAAVRVITTSDGPWSEDLYICLENADGGGCAVPNAHAAPVVGYLTKLAGFDVETFLRALACTNDGEFLCWTRPRAAA